MRFNRNRNGDRCVWAHWSNENTDDYGRKKFPWHGRFWLYFWDNTFSFEWVLFRRCDFSISLTVDAYGGDRDLSWHVGVPGLTLYFGLERLWPRPWRLALSQWWRKHLDYPSREIALRVHHGSLWWDLWTKEGESGSFPRWREGSFNLADFLLGSVQHSSIVMKTEEAVVPMPERAYRAKVEIIERRYKRPRWPFTKVFTTANVDMHEGEQVPLPGKGTMSYNMGQDATYSMSCSESTVDGAVAAMVRSTLERRRRYGGQNWVPEETGSKSQ